MISFILGFVLMTVNGKNKMGKIFSGGDPRAQGAMRGGGATGRAEISLHLRFLYTENPETPCLCGFCEFSVFRFLYTDTTLL